MTRAETLLSVAGLAVVAVAVRAVAAALVVFPKPEDTAYYVGVARNLLEGRGLVSDALWSYATPPLVFPRPAFEVWLPLPTFLVAVPMAILGPTFAAAQVGSIVVGAVVVVLAWRLAADVAAERGLPPERARTLALASGLTAAIYLPLVLHSALPDSTMPFTALALGACLLMTRIAAEPRGAGLLDPRLVGLGALLGLAALTRNEAAWLAVAWLAVAWTATTTTSERIRLVAIPAVVALAVFAPWAWRDWQAFGSPLPGQALANALSLDGRDIFAWSEPPTLARYLAAGPAELLRLRVTGVLHNLLNVLLLLGIPISAIGLVALARFGRARSLRPLVIYSLATFAVTSLLFPVSTTWGTFLHAAGPIHVLLIVGCLLALDALIARIGEWRGWTRPVAWLGAALTVFGGAVFTMALLPGFGAGSRATAAQYAALEERMATIGWPLAREAAVITNFPIWLAETTRVPALALPDEPPAAVVDLARAFPGTRLVIVEGRDHDHWPADVDAGLPGADCFRELDLGVSQGLDGPAQPLAGTRAFEIVCR